jgi:hypothetical protein
LVVVIWFPLFPRNPCQRWETLSSAHRGKLNQFCEFPQLDTGRYPPLRFSRRRSRKRYSACISFSKKCTRLWGYRATSERRQIEAELNWHKQKLAAATAEQDRTIDAVPLS